MTTSTRRAHRRHPEWTSYALLLSIALWFSVAILVAKKMTIFRQWPGNSELQSEQGQGNPREILLSRRQLGATTKHQQASQDPFDNPSSPSPTPNISTFPPTDQRISGLGPSLAPDLLHGGWKFTKSVFSSSAFYPNATVISWESPRVILIKQFLSSEEVAHMMELAESGFQRSEVVGGREQHITDARTSYGTWLNGPRRTSTVLNIQHRIAELTQIPEEFGESIYVLRYQRGQKYEAHTDHCHHSAEEMIDEPCKEFLKRAGGPGCGPGQGGASCGDRIATLVMYLLSPEKGGATAFPAAKDYALPPNMKQKAAVGGLELTETEAAAPFEADGNTEKNVPWYCQENANVLKVVPESGDAVLFYDYVPVGGEAVADPTSAHAGCPPLLGTKVIATRWIRAANFS